MRRSEFASWKHDSVTRYILERVAALKAESEKLILSGKLLNSPDFETQYSKHLGVIEAIDKVINIENYLEITEED